MIGAWVARWRERSSGLRIVTRYHLVESEIAGRQVTRCGRQLAPRDGTELAFATEPPVSERCTRCDRGR